MKTTILSLFLIANFIGYSQNNMNYAKDQIIVKFKTDHSKETLNNQQRFSNVELSQLNKKVNVSVLKTIQNKEQNNVSLIKFENTNYSIEEIIELYQNTGLFEYVEPNYIGSGGGHREVLETIPNDTYFSRQWGLDNDGTFAISTAISDADIDMNFAWEIEQGDSNIVVAVLDIGTKMDHPEFEGRIWLNKKENSNTSDSDMNDYVDDIYGWDFANNDNDPSDDQGHGTNVAGIIGTNANNQTGYSGIDWNCKLMICKILDETNYGLYSWWSEAIYYAVDNGADVINMSVGGTSYSNLLKDAVDYAYNNGVIIVACMMNNNNDVVNYPAGFLNTIAVGSTNPNDERSEPFFWSSTSGSNYGSHIDVVAPGNFIYGLDYLSDTNYNSYWGGTSQATPLVAGLSALLLAQNPDRSPDEIRSIIRETAEDMVGKPSEDSLGFDIYHGYGRINAYEALLINPISAIKKELTKEDFSVYPNPTSDNLTIKGKLNNTTISIRTILGEEIFRKEASDYSSELNIDTSDFPKGFYIINPLCI